MHNSVLIGGVVMTEVMVVIVMVSAGRYARGVIGSTSKSPNNGNERSISGSGNGKNPAGWAMVTIVQVIETAAGP